jgi:plastocyanin
VSGRGFLGTNASLLSDLSLALGLLVALTLTFGVIMARRRKIQVHRWVQSTAVTLNVLQVGLIMLGSFARSAAPGLPDRVGEPYYWMALAHGLLGLVTLLLGVFIAIRANELLPRFLHFLRFHNFKLFMRSAYGLYMASTLLGVGVYLTWYGPRRPAEVAQTQLATAVDEVVVPMMGFEFAPRDLVVTVGSTVVWINQDAAPHTATADDGGAFASDLLTAGQTFRFTPTEAGEFAYFCELHGSAGGIGMAGTLTVVAADQAPARVAAAPVIVPTAAPTARLTGLPAQAGPAINRLILDGPGVPIRQGFAAGLKHETQELARHARLLIAAEATGDLAGTRRHAEHALNLIVGARDPDFGDHDRDGSAQNAGDGFGLLVNGAQLGYIQATLESASAAERASDASDAIKIHAVHVRVSTDNVQLWASQARGLALELTRVEELSLVGHPASRLLTLAKWMELGNDLNGDGELSPVPGESGALVAYEHARFMAGLDPSITTAHHP